MFSAVAALCWLNSATAAADPARACPTLQTNIQSEPVFDAVTGMLEHHAGDGKKARYSGAVALVAHQGEVIYHQAVGQAQRFEVSVDGTLVERAQPVAMTRQTLFDLASVTKVAATTVGLMHLVSEGGLSLDDTLAEHLPEMAGTDKADITLRQLLTHRSGLWQWQPSWLFLDPQTPDVLDYLADLPRRYPIGERRAYSDFGFILLGKVIERVSGLPLDEFVNQTIYQPLGMEDTQYRPPAELKQRIAATSHGNPFERRMVASGEPYPLARPIPASTDFDYRTHTLIGEVSDGNAFYGLQGVAGHAGLFSTAKDLAILGQMLLNQGCYGDAKMTESEAVEQFLTAPYDSQQALGFWKSERQDGGVIYWHPGFTGTQFLIQPHRQLVVILLTNRQHPALPDPEGGYPSVSPVWQKLLDHVDAFLATSSRP